MGKGRSPERRVQKAKRSSRRISKEDSHLYAVRRPLDKNSYGLFEDVSCRLSTDIDGVGRLFMPSSLAVTLVGYTRFRKPDPRNPIRTIDVINSIESAHHSASVTIGRLGVFGAGSKHKLAFSLKSAELVSEVRAFEHKFEDKGYPLRQDYNAEGDDVSLHCSVALINSDFVDYFKTPDVLKRLDSVAGICGKTATLASVHKPDSL